MCLEVCFATPGRRLDEGRLTTLSCMKFLGAVSDIDLREGPSRHQRWSLDGIRHRSYCSAGGDYAWRACPPHSVPKVRLESQSAPNKTFRSNPLPPPLPPMALPHGIRAFLQGSPPQLPPSIKGIGPCPIDHTRSDEPTGVDPDVAAMSDRPVS